MDISQQTASRSASPPPSTSASASTPSLRSSIRPRSRSWASADSPTPAEGGITWRKAMTLSLTVDHRGVDGAPAARFLAGVADRLQAPAALL
ncbi:MAG TPA: 2-oxo acid dehydrogenase subunit E2 [Streptosporangiaceae bacterium]|nr:2-oxo acid dehydrogenase subunit E2 [Streptosporangiaceae bacterium]